MVQYLLIIAIITIKLTIWFGVLQYLDKQVPSGQANVYVAVPIVLCEATASVHTTANHYGAVFV